MHFWRVRHLVRPNTLDSGVGGEKASCGVGEPKKRPSTCRKSLLAKVLFGNSLQTFYQFVFARYGDFLESWCLRARNRHLRVVLDVVSGPKS